MMIVSLPFSFLLLQQRHLGGHVYLSAQASGGHVHVSAQTSREDNGVGKATETLCLQNYMLQKGLSA